MKRLDVTVTGRVQGVAFRHHACRQADALGLVGWVRNQPDGSVRAVAEGAPETLELFLAWLSRGPDHARVDTCSPRWQDPTGEFTTFRVTG